MIERIFRFLKLNFTTQSIVICFNENRLIYIFVFLNINECLKLLSYFMKSIIIRWKINKKKINYLLNSIVLRS